MKLYTRKDFLTLPAKTIYSRVDKETDSLCYGLFCKVSGGEYTNDWVEQDLIAQPAYPDGIVDSMFKIHPVLKVVDNIFAIQSQLEKRDTFQQFQTDLHCGGRDGMFEDSDVFVVWDKEDITAIIQYLTDALQSHD